MLLGTTALASATSAHAQVDTSSITDEIVVRGVNIPDEKRATSEISSVLTPEKLERQGDADIAEALRRVTGLSLSQGKFIVVRGLNERYSSLTLNGSPLPSPEPLRRVAPLDLFPVSVVGTALVQKTFSPEFSGEFGGGLIELRSKSVPEEDFLQFGIGVGVDTATTARDGLTFDGGDRDWTGFDDGTRNFPTPLATAFGQFSGQAIRTESGVPAAQIREIGASLVNSELRVIEEVSTPVNWNGNVAGGQRFDLDNGMSIGYVVNLGYSRDFQTKDGEQGSAALGPNGTVIQGITDFELLSTTETVRTNALFSTGIEFNPDHSLTLLAMGLRKTTKEARERLGSNALDETNGAESIFSNLEFFENQVWTLQGNSEHYFEALGGLSADFRVAYSEAFRDAPYETEYQYFREGPDEQFRSVIGLASGRSPTGFTTQFSKVEDSSFSSGGDFSLPFTIGEADIELKAGGSYQDLDRDYILRQFGFVNETGLPDDDPLFFQRIDFLLADQNIGEVGGFEFVEAPDSIQPQAYTGDLEIFAGYVGFDAQLTPYIRAAAGVRYETSEQIVDNFQIAGFVPQANAGPESIIDEDYFLPAVTITWNPLDDVQVRAGFSQTITRPQFQELGAAVFTDTDRDLQIFGNPFLRNTETDNYDIRFEYYFGREQFVTLGAFYKELTNPIEESLSQTGDSINATYINAPSADLYGLEFEYEQRFAMGDFFRAGFAETKDLIINANYTWSQSDVSADGEVSTAIFNANSIVENRVDASTQFRDGRALQGQSNHIVNFQIGYEDFEADSRATILVNWNSERIRQVGLLQGGAVPDTVERLPVTVDFVYGRKIDLFGGDFDLQAKVGNILNDRYEATADGADGTSIPIDVYDLGTTLSMSLKKEF